MRKIGSLDHFAGSFLLDPGQNVANCRQILLYPPDDFLIYVTGVVFFGPISPDVFFQALRTINELKEDVHFDRILGLDQIFVVIVAKFVQAEQTKISKNPI